MEQGGAAGMGMRIRLIPTGSASNLWSTPLSTLGSSFFLCNRSTRTTGVRLILFMNTFKDAPSTRCSARF